MCRGIAKNFSVLLIAVAVIIASNNCVSADDLKVYSQGEIHSSEEGSVETKSIKDYDMYISDNTDFFSAKENIIIKANTFVSAEHVIVGNYLDENNMVFWNSGSIKYRFNVQNGGRYNLSLKYLCISDNNMNAEIGLSVDDKLPFREASNIEIKRMWTNAAEVRKDDFGNEFAPEQTAYEGFCTIPLYDNTGVVLDPYEFCLESGNHEITLVLNSGKLALSEIALTVPDNAEKAYKEVAEEYSKNGYKEYSRKSIVIEGEKAEIKNTNSIVPLSDNTSKLLTPSSATNTVINYIGSTNWENSTEEISWNVNVPEDGLYKLGIMYKQDQIINGNSYRRLRIDGYTPFKEAAAIAFPYDTSWKFYEFGNGEEPYLFYLTEGQHRLSLSVTMGNTADFYSRLKAVTEALGDLYIDIVMITGESPDTSRDYELFKQIPDYYEILKENHNELTALIKDMQELTGERSNSQIAAIKNMARVLKSMTDEAYTAHLYVKDYYTNYTTVSSWLYEMTVMPLSIDQIRLVAPKKDFGEKKVGLFERLIFSVVRFVTSFSNEYNNISKTDNGDGTLKIWVNWGRDQAQVLNSMIQDSFTPKTGIKVNLEIVNADLIKGILSDNQPDLALHMSRAKPVNLAMRGALYDLTKFDDYEKVLARFGESSSIPYKYGNGVYALPDTQSFYLMFYRKDILEELDIPIPSTWDEFMAATAVLQRNNMNSYIPYTKIVAATTTDTGVGGLNLFASILMQSGGKFYNDSLDASMLTDTTALDAFEFWTNMYTQYKLPVEAEFYNRFRVGTCPLGISGYTQYTTFLQAAPEIQGRWGIALVPGIKQEDGSINRTVSGSGTGCAILEKSENKEEAWEFLKWWTSDETQLRYNSNVESILGAVARITTANVNAFAQMGWEEDDLEILLKQREQIQEIPEIPGSYYLTRSVDQAFWSVINGNSSVKDALNKWGREANEEIKRKISEYEGE